MNSDHVLLLFLPVELLTLEFTRILNLLALLLEPLMGKVINFLDIVDVLFAFMLSMVINLERSLGSHEVRISLRVVVSRYLFPVQCQTYYSSHVILSAVHTILNKLVKSLILSVEIISRLVESIHVFLAF